MAATADLILDVAEARIRMDGFHAVSFNDIATELGIKSASVHDHFPKKEDPALQSSNAIPSGSLRNSMRRFRQASRAASRWSLPAGPRCEKTIAPVFAV